MRALIFPLLSVTMSFWSCEEGEVKTDAAAQIRDTIPPVISIAGKKCDTAYLQIASTTLIANGSSSYTWLPGNSANSYADPGPGVLEEPDGRCTNIPVEITGTVNIRFPGTYYLHYNAKDAAGNQAATITRTVHVVENSAAFLNGNYNVACSCTAGIAGSPNPTITTINYIANAATSGRINNSFELSMLRIGPEYVVASAYLSGTSMEVGYFSPYYANTSASGTLSAAKHTFTIETKMQEWSPSITYRCKNVYTKSNIDVAYE